MVRRSTVLSQRVGRIEPSGIRRIFELMATMEDPINLSIGQAHYEPSEELVDAACRALREGHHRYTVTQGLPELNERLLDGLARQHGCRPESSLLTSGVSGGLMLSFLVLLDPGDEILLPDPYFTMYSALASVLGVVPKYYSTYPDAHGERFRIDADELESLVTERTRVLFLNSPSNPTGAVWSERELQAACTVANRHNLVVLSDEIYDFFAYDGAYHSPVNAADRCVQLRGFSKTWAIPGWRMGYAAGPSEIIDAMRTVQQFSFVCAPAPFQYAVLEAAFDVDLQPHFHSYKDKRDRLTKELDPRYGLAAPEGSFFAFPELPGGCSSDEFVPRALEHRLLIVPGKAFSRRDTHFRLSFAVDDDVLERGIKVLNELAAECP